MVDIWFRKTTKHFKKLKILLVNRLSLSMLIHVCALGRKCPVQGVLMYLKFTWSVLDRVYWILDWGSHFRSSTPYIHIMKE